MKQGLQLAEAREMKGDQVALWRARRDRKEEQLKP